MDETAATDSWVPTTTEFGARLALLRWQMRWNMKEAALACGLPPQNWRQWELMISMPRNLVEVATRISDRTKCDLYWLLTGRITPAREQETPIFPKVGRRPAVLRSTLAA